MTVIGEQGLQMIRGDDDGFTFRIEDYEFTTDTVEFGVKESTELGEPYLIHKTVTSFTDNKAVIQIDSADTAEIDAGTYYYDVQVTWASTGLKTTAIRAQKFVIKGDVIN